MNTNHVKNAQGVVTPDMLHHLPAPVQRYLTYTGVVGKPWINTVDLRYAGRFRTGADKPWMPMAVHQVYTTNPPAFRWRARFKVAGLPLLRGDDTYKDGHGHMFGKLAGLVTVFDARGDEMDQGTMLRYLQEMVWFPTAFLGENITWQAVSDHAADVTFHDCGRSVTGRLFFDDDGRMITFTAQRYAEINGGFSLQTWTTPMIEYGVQAGLNLPVHGQGVWHLPEGDLAYVDLRVTELEYNQPIEAF